MSKFKYQTTELLDTTEDYPALYRVAHDGEIIIEAIFADALRSSEIVSVLSLRVAHQVSHMGVLSYVYGAWKLQPCPYCER